MISRLVSFPVRCALRGLRAVGPITAVLALLGSATTAWSASPTFTVANSTFPSTPVGQSSQQTVTLTVNTAVPITSIKIASNFTEYTLGSITGSGCTIDPTGNTVVAAGTVCSIAVTFKPELPGLAGAPPPIGRSAPLLVTDVESGKANGYSFALSGTATGPLFAFAPGYVTGLVGNSTTRGCTAQLDNAGDGCPAIDGFVITSSTAVDAAGNIYISNGVGKVIHKVDPTTGMLSVFAGQYFVQGESGNGGPATSAEFFEPYTIAVDQAGNVYLNDLTNGFGNDTGELWKINAATGVATIISTTGSFPGPFQLAAAVAGGKTISETAVPWMTGMVVDASGNIYFTGLNYGGVYRIDAVTGVVSIVVGDGTPTFPAKGIPGPGTSALVGVTQPLAMDGNGNLYIGDTENGLVYKLNTSTGQLTVAAGTQSATASNSICTTQGDWGPATSAPLGTPGTLSLDAAGNLYIAASLADNGGCQIRRVDALTGTIHSIAGDTTNFYQSVENAGANDTSLAPYQVIVDGGGNIYVSQQADIVGIQKIVAGESGVNFRQQSQDVTATQLVTASNIGVQTELTLSNYPFPIVAGAGSATPMPFTSPELQGSNPQDCAVGTLPAGGVCGIQVSFDPVANGSYNATETVIDNSLGNAATSNVINITGSAYNNQTVALTPSPVAFGSQAVGTASSPMQVSFASALSPSITFGAATLSGAGAGSYQVTTGANSCTANEALAGAGGVCDIYVVFNPLTGGPLPATLTATYVAGGVSYAVSVAVTGSGEMAAPSTVTLSPNPYVFAATTVEQGLQSGSGGLSAITLTNNGTTPLTFTGAKPFTILGPSNTPFSVFPNGSCTITYLEFNLPLPAGASCTITVQFFPGNAGAFAATLSVADNASNSPQTITVSGTGAAGQLQFFPAQINIVAGNESSPGGNGPGESGDGGLATAATLDGGYGVAFDGFGNLYFSDYDLNTVREINSSGDISVYAGVPGGAGGDTGDNGAAASATLFHPEQIAFDPFGNFYIADQSNNAVREVNPAGTITTFYGAGCSTCSGSAGALSSPDGVASDSVGNLYVGNLNYSVFKISPGGVGTPFAGTGVEGYSGDNGPATQAKLGQVRQVATDLAGNVYIADYTNGVVRKVDTSGTITTYAGGGTSAVTTTPQLATAVNLNAGPIALVTDPNGDLYVVGGGGSGQAQVYFINTSQQISLIAGGGQTAGSGIPANAANINPGGIGIDTSGDVYLNDPYNHVIAETGPQGQLVFGSQAVGSTSTAMTLTLTNTGNAPVSFYNPNDEGVVTGRHRLAASALKKAGHGAVPEGISGGVSAITGDFAIASGGTCNIDTSNGLSPGESCTLNVTFSPTATGARTGTITLYTELPYESNVSTVQLSGTGTQVAAPAVTLTPSLAFPTTTAGTTSSALVATLTNTGNGPLTIDGISIAGTNPGDFAITTGANDCTTVVQAGGSCSIYVTFTPASAASFTATLQVTDNAAGSPQTSTLTGTGTPPPAPVVTLAPNPVAFASQTIGVTSAATTVTLTNSGNAPLTITGISITGTNATDFATTTGSNPCGSTLAAGASCSINVTFTAAAAGSFAATLSIADNAAGSPQTVALSGSGINPADFTVSATPASQSVAPGGATTYTVTVSSTGGTFTNPVALTVSGLPAGATGTFSSTPVTPGTSGVPSTLTVQTSASTQQTARNSAWPLAAPVLAAVGLFFIPGKRRRRWIGLGMLLLASLGALTALSGCGGGFRFVQPPQTYTLSITGTSGDDTHSTTVQLTVE